MNILRKTTTCTIGAFGYNNPGSGVSLGVVQGKPGNKSVYAVASLEENDGKLVLLVDDRRLQEFNIEIKHCDYGKGSF